MFEDPQFWVAVAFVIFVMLTAKPVGKLLCGVLDSRSEKIKKELDEAASLKEEAQALLASYQRKQQEAEQEAEKIVNQAQLESKRIISEAEQNLEITLNKKIQIALQKVATYEQSVVQELREHAVDVAIKTVRALVKENFNGKLSDEMVEKSITEMTGELSKLHKAH